MNFISRIQLIRKIHSLVPNTEDKNLKKIITYINNYNDNINQLKKRKEYLNLLRNIYNTIPSRLNERELWNNFLNKLKTKKSYFKLEKIIKNNTVIHDSLISRQVVFLYYIGFDDEITYLLDKLEFKLRKCSEKNFRECDKYINEDINDVIKMLYVLYYFRNKENDYKNVILLFDKFIYYSKKYPVNNLKYLFYFHLFYFNMNNSLIKIHKCLEKYSHLLLTEQLMLLIRYINIYLKYLYLHNAIKHKNDTTCEEKIYNSENELFNECLFIDNKKNEEIKILNEYEDINRKKMITKEINIFINNLFRINKNEKEYFIFDSFDDIEIKNSCVKNYSLMENKILFNKDNLIKEGKNRSNIKDKEILLNNSGNISNDKCLSKNNINEDSDLLNLNGDNNFDKKNNSILQNNIIDNNNNDNIINEYNLKYIDIVEEKYSKNRKILKKEEITLTENELKLYKSIYGSCVKEILKNILLNKEKISPDIMWNNFISNFFKDEYIYILMNELKNKMNIISEEEFLIFLKQVKLLKLYENSSFFTISNTFFKNYIIQKKYFKNIILADKLTYYTDIFCYNSFLQKYILYIYKLNFNKLTIKILKKILSKLYYFLQQNKSLINGFDKFIKNTMIKIILNGSLNDIVMLLYSLRQYNFYKTYVNRKKNDKKKINNDYNMFSSDYNYLEKGCYNYIYEYIKKKVKHLSPLISSDDNLKNIENFNLFHLNNYNLYQLKNDYLKIYKLICYRTIIEKKEIQKLNYDKYFDINIVIMIEKQLIKLFCIFINKFCDSIKNDDNKLNIFECINNFFVDNQYYNLKNNSDGIFPSLEEKINKNKLFILNRSLKKETNEVKEHLLDYNELSKKKIYEHNLDENEFIKSKLVENKLNKDKVSEYSNFNILKKKMCISTMNNYMKKYEFEYNTIKRFIDLLLMIIIDNYLYFEIKNFYFINFFFLLFQNNFLSMSIYHYFFFLYIFKNLNYNQISQKEKKEFFFSEEYFNKNKNEIINICNDKLISIIRDYVSSQINKNKNVHYERNDTINNGNDKNKSTENYSDCFLQNKSDIFDFDCMMTLILYNLKNDEISNIFQNCFLFSLNNYLKIKNVYIKYGNYTYLKNMEHNNELNILSCNNIKEISSLFHFNEGNKDNLSNDHIIKKYQFFYINMIYDRLMKNYDEGDFECYINFLTDRKSYEAVEVLKVCMWMKKYNQNDKIKLIINNINTHLNSYKKLEFYISYLFLIVLYQKNYLDDIYKIFNEINKYLLNNDINSFWYILLVQIIYLIKIKNLFLFDLLFMQYQNISIFYNDVIKLKKKCYEKINDHDINSCKSSILKFLKNNQVFFIKNIELKCSPFIFDIYIPSRNIFFINQNKYIFSDIFIEYLQDNIFDKMNSKIIKIDEQSINSLNTIL
ncbi:conserved Plasmodium protein, unknown function [Plasmodium gallinaceum]|uniref:Uncharacterized protein n=1 Tax=Plasmodium gallinaceum TaxID=5849 RepID=A0A1J1GWE4_PLAGA|nr:conserved Plasmodium protein, unknown function [Plasmodium gallinaceum]CRG95325.1 conserved Plasmodium protein, unknown function [Plasmodium gallinaceum]